MSSVEDSWQVQKWAKGGRGGGRWTKIILSCLLLTRVACFVSVKNVSCTWTGTDKCGLLCLCEKRQLHMDWYWQVWLALSLWKTSAAHGLVLTSVACFVSVKNVICTWTGTDKCGLLCLWITSVSHGVVLTSVSAGYNLSVPLIVLCETWPSTPDSHLPFPRWLIDCRA